MGEKSQIQWTDATWNPVVGCERISPGCANCYAKNMHDRRHKAVLDGKSMPPQYADDGHAAVDAIGSTVPASP